METLKGDSLLLTYIGKNIKLNDLSLEDIEVIKMFSELLVKEIDKQINLINTGGIYRKFFYENKEALLEGYHKLKNELEALNKKV